MADPMERLGSEDAIGMESCMKEDLCMEIDPPFRENVATAEDWRKALNNVVPAVVVLRTTACRAFDTEAAGASYATGFVVDKRRGIILTNRHVVKPGMLGALYLISTCIVIFFLLNFVSLLWFIGPVVAEAMFVNREEIPVFPVYRDPVSTVLLSYIYMCIYILIRSKDILDIDKMYERRMRSLFKKYNVHYKGNCTFLLLLLMMISAV